MPSSPCDPAGGTPEEQLSSFAAPSRGRRSRGRSFPQMWLREMADGGRHLDASVIGEFRRILATLGAILGEGQRAGDFVKADPFIVQISIVAPLMFFAASAPLRRAGRASCCRRHLPAPSWTT